ncbi:MAG: TonB-dependent receptor, partial [Bacteroidota bacterium]
LSIRGTDITRINVTINGIPLNDSESQGVFWVNMPDFASSLDNVQIQRGVGTSTNGGAAFGATINLLTDSNRPEAYAEADFGYGAFNTQKYTLQFGSGLLDGRWALDGRLSRILSDGYVDRARSNLQSYFIQGGYYGDQTTLQFIHFNGAEETYQSWFGTPEAALTGDVEAKEAYADTEGLNEAQRQNLLSSDRRYNHYLYENEVDNYRQSHYQLHLTHAFQPRLTASASLHYTGGQGFFEQFRDDDDFEDYGLPNLTLGNETVESTDLIRRRWLDNSFYGFVSSLIYTGPDWSLTAGAAYNDYTNDHFGEIIWAQFANGTDIRDRYYDNVGDKTDGNVFAKLNYDISARLNVFADAQVRNVTYATNGIDSDLRAIAIDEDYTFFNPKVGLNAQLTPNDRAYALVAVANREPTRTDFLDAALVAPEPERLVDYELGFERRTRNYLVAANLYYMDYTDQLVPTGELNDVGSSVKVNVPSSFRRGIELQAGVRPTPKLEVQANYTLSQNKIEDFTSVVYDYTSGFDIVEDTFDDTDIALSPSHIAGGSVTVQAAKGLEVQLLGKYVGEQFLDNTSNPDRAIDAFFVSDLRIGFTVPNTPARRTQITLLVNNLFDAEYSARGYTYRYIVGDEITRNHFYPQAGINIQAGLNVLF